MFDCLTREFELNHALKESSISIHVTFIPCALNHDSSPLVHDWKVRFEPCFCCALSPRLERATRALSPRLERTARELSPRLVPVYAVLRLRLEPVCVEPEAGTWSVLSLRLEPGLCWA